MTQKTENNERFSLLQPPFDGGAPTAENDEYYMKKALELAKEAAAEGEVPVGAVIVKDGKIIGRGRNRREKIKNALAHAEIEAINEACVALGGWRLPGCTMYVTLEPCPMCAGAIGWSQLGKLVYGAADEKRGYRRYAPDVLHPKTEVISGICADEATALMKKFFASKR